VIAEPKITDRTLDSRSNGIPEDQEQQCHQHPERKGEKADSESGCKARKEQEGTRLSRVFPSAHVWFATATCPDTVGSSGI